MLKALIGVGAVAAAARVAWTIPGTVVPQSGQTLAVLLVGAALGLRAGALSLVIYVLLGVAGLPVFADGAAGWQHTIGPTAGYLFGFVAAAGLVGWAADRRQLSRVGIALGTMVLGHVLILGFGWVRLSWTVGPTGAFSGGVAPFALGGVLKSSVAALLVVAVTRRARTKEVGRSAP